MRTRRRRRTKYTWLPIQGFDTGPEGNPRTLGGIDDNIVAGPVPETNIHPVNPVDIPEEGGDWTVGTSLSDVLGSEYFLKRIVGKFFAASQAVTSTTGNVAEATLITAGFFVARAEGTDPEIPAGVPTGALATDVHTFDNFNPKAQDTVREPWIWRRSWILGNKGMFARALAFDGTGLAAPAYTPYTSYPQNTAGYGSVADGPHVDCKTARRITQDDRLWFAVSAAAMPFAGAENFGLGVVVDYHLDYRLLGALRRPKQTGRF